MALQSDSQGFLVGASIEISDEALSLWRDIQEDVAAIRQQLAAGQRTAQAHADAVNRLAAATSKAVTAPRRSRAASNPRVDLLAGQTAKTSPGPALPQAQQSKSVALPVPGKLADHNAKAVAARSGITAVPHVAAPSPAMASAVQTARPTPERDAQGRFKPSAAVTAGRASAPVVGARDARGRFVAGEGAAEDESARSRRGGLAAGVGALSQAVSGLSRTLAEGSEIDPAIQAANEISSIASGVQDTASTVLGGVKSLFGREDEPDGQVSWLKRLWRGMTRQAGKDSEFHKAQMRVLEDIRDKPPVPPVAGAGAGAMGWLKRLPGAAILAPIGAAIAAAIGGLHLGDIIREKLGLNAPNWERLPDDIRYGFEKLTGRMRGAWDSVVSGFSTLVAAAAAWLKEKTGIDVPGAAKAARGNVVQARAQARKLANWTRRTARRQAAHANRAIKRKTGVDVGDAAIGAGEAVKKAYRGAVDATSRHVVEPIMEAAKGSVSHLIHVGESKARGYNDYNRGSEPGRPSNRASLDLENMTIGEIMDQQSLPRGHQNRLFAVGKYQVIPATMKAAVAALGLSREQKFDKTTQERIFADFLATRKKGRGALERFIKGGEGSAEDAVHAIAQEWASVESPKLGRGVYDGVGVNHAAIRANRMLPAVVAARRAYQHNIAKGMGEKEAYAAALGATPAVQGASTAQAMAAPAPVKMPIPPVPAASPAPAVSAAFPATASVASQPAALPEAPGLVGQDVSDRRIAHIVTGGIGGKG